MVVSGGRANEGSRKSNAYWDIFESIRKNFDPTHEDP